MGSGQSKSVTKESLSSSSSSQESDGGGPGAVTSDGIPIDLGKVPVRIENVHIQGLVRTKEDYVNRGAELGEVFTAKTFQELIFKASEVQRRLEKLGCFRKVGIVIDTSKGDDASDNGYEVIYTVQETGRFVGGINTMVGSNEGSIIFGGRLPNLAGRGERANIEHTIGSNSNRSTMISLTKPLGILKNSDITATLSHHKIPSYWSGFTVFNSGGLIDLSFDTFRRVRHSLQYEGTWRHLEASGRTTSFSVREQCGHSFKSAIKHILTVDHRDHLIFPKAGVLLKSAQEYAGLGGDVGFIKHDSEVQVNVPLPFELILQGAARFGGLKPLDTRAQSHNISDLFFLGGPQTLRGFEMRSLGPHGSNKESLGGKAYWATAFHLYSPLPFNLGKGGFGDMFRMHFFLNAGNVSGLSPSGESRAESLRTFLSDYRAACGIGLAAKLGQMARIELNYCYPFRYAKEDRVVKGVQVGLGVEFL